MDIESFMTGKSWGILETDPLFKFDDSDPTTPQIHH
jgi:hypothetical protein